MDFEGSFQDDEEITKIVAGWGGKLSITNKGYVYTYQWNEPDRLMEELKDYFDRYCFWVEALSW